MKMHLFNIMKQLKVPDRYKEKIVEHFKHEKVSVSAVRRLVEKIKSGEAAPSLQKTVKI
jgi:hypothetical protein